MSLVLTPEGTPASPVEGEVYYDSTADKVKVRDASAFREVVTQDATFNGTIGGNATFPAKAPVSIYYGGMNTGSINMSAGTAYANNDSISLTPKSSTSQFLVVMSGKTARNSTANALYFSFTFGKNSLSTSPVQLVYVTDDPRHNHHTVHLYASPGTSSITWTTSDTLYFGTWARSDGVQGYLEYYSLTVFEYMAN